MIYDYLERDFEDNGAGRHPRARPWPLRSLGAALAVLMAFSVMGMSCPSQDQGKVILSLCSKWNAGLRFATELNNAGELDPDDAAAIDQILPSVSAICEDPDGPSVSRAAFEVMNAAVQIVAVRKAGG